MADGDCDGCYGGLLRRSAMNSILSGFPFFPGITIHQQLKYHDNWRLVAFSGHIAVLLVENRKSKIQSQYQAQHRVLPCRGYP